jgi:guanylate kinase
MDKYDYIVLNDEVEKCVDKIHDLVDAAKHSADRNREFIEMIKEELAELK